MEKLITMKKIIYLCLITLLFVGRKKDKESHFKIFTFTVASEKKINEIENPTETSVFEHYWVKYSTDKKWSAFSDPIIGFNYEDGFEYILKIQQKDRENAELIMDVSCCEYTLLEVISKEKKQSDGIENK